MGRGGGGAGGCSLEVEGLEGGELREARAQQLHGFRVYTVAAAVRRISCMRTGGGGGERGIALHEATGSNPNPAFPGVGDGKPERGAQAPSHGAQGAGSTWDYAERSCRRSGAPPRWRHSPGAVHNIPLSPDVEARQRGAAARQEVGERRGELPPAQVVVADVQREQAALRAQQAAKALEPLSVCARVRVSE